MRATLHHDKSGKRVDKLPLNRHGTRAVQMQGERWATRRETGATGKRKRRAPLATVDGNAEPARTRQKTAGTTMLLAAAAAVVVGTPTVVQASRVDTSAAVKSQLDHADLLDATSKRSFVAFAFVEVFGAPEPVHWQCTNSERGTIRRIQDLMSPQHSASGVDHPGQQTKAGARASKDMIKRVLTQVWACMEAGVTWDPSTRDNVNGGSGGNNKAVEPGSATEQMIANLVERGNSIG